MHVHGCMYAELGPRGREADLAEFVVKGFRRKL